jgi:hypothetical protein
MPSLSPSPPSVAVAHASVTAVALRHPAISAIRLFVRLLERISSHINPRANVAATSAQCLILSEHFPNMHDRTCCCWPKLPGASELLVWNLAECVNDTRVVS